MSFKEMHVNTLEAINLCKRAIEQLNHRREEVEKAIDERKKLIQQEATLEIAAEKECSSLKEKYEGEDKYKSIYRFDMESSHYILSTMLYHHNGHAIKFWPDDHMEDAKKILKACELFEDSYIVMSEQQLQTLQNALKIDMETVVNHFLAEEVKISTKYRGDLAVWQAHDEKMHKEGKPVIEWAVPEEPKKPKSMQDIDTFGWVLLLSIVGFLGALVYIVS